MTQITEHFTLEELLYSETAKKLGLQNFPNPDHFTNLYRLTEKLLEPIRVAWGSGIRITSGYRGTALNKAVKGSATSAHCFGLAADMVPINGKMAEFKKFVRNWLHETGAPYDQYIDEKNKKGSEWVHLALADRKGRIRHQDLYTLDAKNYKNLPVWSPK